MRAHGTRACYVWGPEPGQDRSRGCRCEPCRAANRAYARGWDRARRRPDGDRSPAYIDATEVRRHLRWLQRQGVGRRAVHTASGVALSSIAKLRNGTVTRCRPETAEALLLVFPVDAAPGALVDARPTWRLLDDLIGRGFTRRDLARRLGSTARNPALQVGRTRVTAATATQVRSLHAELTADSAAPRHTPPAAVEDKERLHRAA